VPQALPDYQNLPGDEESLRQEDGMLLRFGRHSLPDEENRTVSNEAWGHPAHAFRGRIDTQRDLS
jgi:hypothetical protein